jgi:hypothetical protein
MPGFSATSRDKELGEMKRVLFAASALALVFSAATAKADGLAIGSMGSALCSYVVQWHGPEFRELDTWIGGFWTGANEVQDAVNPGSGASRTGWATDIRAVVDEQCRQHPTWKLMDAVGAAYGEAWRASK